MSKIMSKWWWVVVSVLLLGICVYGYTQMFFHQDDLDWLLMVRQPFWHVMAAPLGDHIDYLFRLLFKGEWSVFHLSFPGYFLVSVLLHAGTIYLLYRLAFVTSQRRDLAAAAAILFAVNTNWTEVVLWVSGQTISISVFFILLAMLSLWEKKHIFLTQFLSSWTSALALGLPGATLLTYGVTWKKKRLSWVGVAVLLVLLGVAFLYLTRATDGTPLHLSWRWIGQILSVWVLAFVNSVVGRFFIPFDRFETIRLWVTSFGLLTLGYVFRKKWISICKDTWSRFIILQLVFYYLVVAVGRAQYGIGIMRAERYAYLGLALSLLLLVRILRNWQWGRWIWLVPVVMVVQCLGFYSRARQYVIRPEQLRSLFAEVAADPAHVDPDAYLPHFVLHDERLRYADLLILMRH